MLSGLSAGSTYINKCLDYGDNFEEYSQRLSVGEVFSDLLSNLRKFRLIFRLLPLLRHSAATAL